MLKQTVDTLKAHLTSLPMKDRSFAESLIHQFEKKGSLSDKQEPWVFKLADKAQGIPDFTKPEPEKIEVGQMTGLIEMFSNAAKKLKYPAFSLQLPSGLPVRLSRAGEKSKNPGSIYVVAQDFTDAYLRKVSPDGNFMPVGSVKPRLKEELSQLLRKMSCSPAETAAEYGKLTGKCCFCSTPLSDPKSTEVGYGAQCAKNYNLPYGVKKPA
jgi:Family of unknown function (DUF6011)